MNELPRPEWYTREQSERLTYDPDTKHHGGCAGGYAFSTTKFNPADETTPTISMMYELTSGNWIGVVSILDIENLWYEDAEDLDDYLEILNQYQPGHNDMLGSIRTYGFWYTGGDKYEERVTASELWRGDIESVPPVDTSDNHQLVQGFLLTKAQQIWDKYLSEQGA